MPVFQREGKTITYRPRLKIHEQFLSIQGEGSHSGLPCTFIRLTGCALRCTYCDTEYAFYGGAWQSFDDLWAYCVDQGAATVQITGGEPLHQTAVWPFVDGLIERGFRVLVETSGAVTIADLNPLAHIVMDVKTPESGELGRMLWTNFDFLKPSDEVKFVVCSSTDLEWSLDMIRERRLAEQFQVLISPVAESTSMGEWAERVLRSGLNVRFQIQLHKVLWGNEAGR